MCRDSRRRAKDVLFDPDPRLCPQTLPKDAPRLRRAGFRMFLHVCAENIFLV